MFGSAQYRGEPRLKGRYCIYDRAISEHSRRSVPFRLHAVECNQIPEYAPALAAARVGCKVIAQLMRYQMPLVPVLNSSYV